MLISNYQKLTTTTDENDGPQLVNFLQRLTTNELKLKKIFADIDYNGLPTRSLVAEYGAEITVIQRPRKGFYVTDSVDECQ